MERGYWERVEEMISVCGPRSWPSLLASRTELEEAAAIVKGLHAPRLADSSSSSSSSSTTTMGVEKCKYLVRASFHPDTGEIIPWPLRMAAHVPVNAILLVGMLAPRSVLWTGVWQAMNQSFNALQFYANRNASNTGTTSSSSAIAAAYGAAVVSSVAVGAGLRSWQLRAEANLLSKAAAVSSPSSPSSSMGLRFLTYSIPFWGAAAGKPLQIGIMRQDELKNGVLVSDDDGNVYGSSIVAGQTAVGTTIFTRVTYLAPMLWMPLVQEHILERFIPLLKRNRIAGIVSYTLHAAINSAFVTPLCIAMFDQRASLPASVLEPQFHGLIDPKSGEVIKRLYFNKGL